MSLVAAAGEDPSTLSTRGAKFDDLHRGGWDPKAREAIRIATKSSPRLSIRPWEWCSVIIPTSHMNAPVSTPTIVG